MLSFFSTIYCWFDKLFGVNVAEHLKGWSDANGGGFTNTNHFPTIGSITLCISLVVFLLFYYIINHPRFNKWWSWLIMMLLQAFMSLFFGYWYLRDELINGKIADSLMYVRDDEGEIIQTIIDNSSCWQFGFANMIISIIIFIILTISLKWWSTNCKNCPF